MTTFYSENPSVNDFQSLELNDLLRSDLGIKGFQEIHKTICEIHSMISIMISKSESNESIPEGVKNEVLNIVSEFNRLVSLIKKYDLDQDGRNGFSQRTGIIQQIKTWYESIFKGISDRNNNSVNFLQIYNTIVLNNLSSVNSEVSEFIKLKSDLKETQRQANDIIKTLNSKASEEVVQDYALIFQNQAEIHSCFEISINKPRIKLGNAQRWFSLSLILLVVFGWIIVHINEVFPIHFEKSSPSIITIELVTRFLLISVAVYIISFSFKQYNIQKHLHTLNKHRQNTLNSFKLFIGALDNDDSITRNALMMEVAKAIYESGQTGYISNKDGADSNPSIIEMTRFVGKS